MFVTFIISRLAKNSNLEYFSAAINQILHYIARSFEKNIIFEGKKNKN